LYGTLYGNRHHVHSKIRDKEKSDQFLEKIHRIPVILLMGIIIPILLLYVIFFITQLAYILPFFQGLVPERLDASIYARRGFYELCGVSGFNLCLWALLRVFGQKGKKTILPRVIGLSLSAVSLGMLVIALRKMVLNIDINGLTLPRVYVMAFMALLGIVFIFIVVRLFVSKFPIEKSVIATVIVLLLGLSFSNPNYWVTQYNVSACEAGRLDYLNIQGMYEMGSSATPALIRVLSSERTSREYKRDAARFLSIKLEAAEAREKVSGSWRAANISGLMSVQMIRENIDLIRAHYSGE
jgi:hypothetical protein